MLNSRKHLGRRVGSDNTHRVGIEGHCDNWKPGRCGRHRPGYDMTVPQVDSVEHPDGYASARTVRAELAESVVAHEQTLSGETSDDSK